MPLSDLWTACQTIVTRLVDDVHRERRIEVSDLIARNQRYGFLFFAAEIDGEPIIKDAQNTIDAEYRCLKELAGNSGD